MAMGCGKRETGKRRRADRLGKNGLGNGVEREERTQKRVNSRYVLVDWAS